MKCSLFGMKLQVQKGILLLHHSLSAFPGLTRCSVRFFMPQGACTSPTVTRGTGTVPSSAPAVQRPSSAAVRRPTGAPAPMELMALLRDETTAETELVRRGETVAVQRINHLKSQCLAHERHIAALTASLASQSDMLRDMQATVALIVQGLSAPLSPGRPEIQSDAIARLITLDKRLQRGLAAKSAR